MPTGRTSSRCGSTLSASNRGFWDVPPPCRVFSRSRNWSRCWAGPGIPPASLGPVLPGNPSAGGWDTAIKDLERRGWVVESPRVGVLGWAGGTVGCHSRGLSPCWGCHTVLGPLCRGLWHCAMVGCAMAGVSHRARGYRGCHTVPAVTMPRDAYCGMCATCTAPCPGVPCRVCGAGPGCAALSRAWAGLRVCMQGTLRVLKCTGGMYRSWAV